MLHTLEDWIKPKADEIATFTQLRALNQGNKTLSIYIQDVRRLVDLCNLDCNDEKDKLIRNSIIQYFHWPNPGSQSAYRMTGSSSSKTNAYVCCYVNKWRKAAFYKDFIDKYTAV